ncbi:Y-family DNA polymerase [Candidatus Protochlamydia amoebophila]|nr:Y-family DNA polymerase [Candidatus Protochlamydia amoebophila]
MSFMLSNSDCVESLSRDQFILVDCNNFYVSCERLFNPNLEKKPVVVLSNNDGCVISRSQEAKLLGVKMGEPYFQIKALCEFRNIQVFSSNYALYGDISERIMNLLFEHAPDLDIYSIDEAFLKYPSSVAPSDLVSLCHELQKKVKKWVGMPISLGLANTKTLAKMANDLAKKIQNFYVFDLNSSVRQKVLQNYLIGDVWGIGRNLKEKLNGMNIHTAWEYAQMDPSIIRKRLGVIGERILWELRGVSCLESDEKVSKKSLLYSRSFGHVLSEITPLSEALSTYVYTVAEKLRAQGSLAKALYIFLEYQIQPGKKMRCYDSITEIFPAPTKDTGEMIKAAKRGLNKIFRREERYKKCGVILLDLLPESSSNSDLFLNPVDPKRTQLMNTMDALNARFGKKKLFFGAMGTDVSWKSRKDCSSKHNPSNWQQLPIVLAK